MEVMYPACFYKEENGMLSVVFPDLYNLATCGNTLEEARKMAVDCLAGYLFIANEEGEVVPPPSEIKNIFPDTCYVTAKGCLIQYIIVDVEKYAKIHFSDCFLVDDKAACIAKKLIK